MTDTKSEKIEQEPKEVILKITSSQEPGYAKSVAGAMGWILRDKGYCKARAVKMAAVNTAIKAVAIVNERVSRADAGLLFEVDMFFSPAENDGGTPSTAVAMTVQAVQSARPSEFLEYKVSGKKEENDALVSKLAGAIASPVRTGKCIRLRCIGPGAVYRAVLASIIAKGMIYPNGLTSVIVPHWATIEDHEKPISVIELEFWGRPIA